MKMGLMSPVGIVEIDEEKNFSIYPNPATESITIRLSGIGENQPVQLYNSMGQLIKEVEVSQTAQVNISDFVNEIYFIKLKNHPEQVQKLIK